MRIPDENTNDGLSEYTKHGCLSKADIQPLGQMYKITLAAFLLLFPAMFLGPSLIFLIILVAVALSIYLLIRGIIQQRKKTKGLVAEDGYIKASIIMPLILIPAIALISSAITVYIVSRFSTHWLEENSEVLFHYIERNDGELPPADKWCDVLAESELENNPFASLKEYKNSNECVLNKNIYGLSGKIPSDMVLMFSGERGWNLVGGPELADKRGHVVVIFGDKHAEKVRANHLDHLRWTIEEARTSPSINKASLYSIALGLLVISTIPFIRTVRFLKRYWLFVILIAISSMLLGTLFSFFAEQIYYNINHKSNIISYWTGAILGLLIGLAYALIIAKKYASKDQMVSMVGFATTAGAITGIIASTFAHAFLMVFYNESNPTFMICGIPFGVLCGTALGWISSGLIKLYKPKQEISKGYEELAS